ncbi:hypothetical protein LCGC14_0362160 [marine sediment metagenome]|uniref:Uncharacterized protein n=1 Tax=marine sediment metagenome TaxID=412755 RepID=A0A0F9WFW9_9ZZZZ
MNLEFVRITTLDSFKLIPRHLFEQIGGRSWTVDRLFKLGTQVLTMPPKCFWVLMDENSHVKGLLWIVIDVLSEKVNVIAFSVDPDCSDESDLDMAIEFLRRFIKDFNSIDSDIKLKDKINWITDEPEKFKDHVIPKTRIIEV